MTPRTTQRAGDGENVDGGEGRGRDRGLGRYIEPGVGPSPSTPSPMNQPPRGSGTERDDFETLRAFRGDIWFSAEDHNADAAGAVTTFDQALDALARTIEQQQARIEEWEHAVSEWAAAFESRGDNDTDGWKRQAKATTHLLMVSHKLLNQNPPNPRSAEA